MGTIRPLIGQSQTLWCVPPDSYPKPDVSWDIWDEGTRTSKPVKSSKRVAIMPDGKYYNPSIVVFIYIYWVKNR